MKRRLFTLALFLLLGAVVNVTVAWGFAVRVVPPTPRWAVADQEGLYLDQGSVSLWWCQVTRRLGYTEVVLEPIDIATRRVPSAFSGDVVVEVQEEAIVESTLYHMWRRRNMIHRPGDPPDTPPWMDSDAVPRWARNPQEIAPWGQVRSALGWPSAAFWYEAALDFQLSGRRGFEGWKLPDNFQFLGPGSVLPDRVIPIGFALNTLFYAALLWLAIPGPLVIRRFIRRKRGLCFVCGYDLRGNPLDGCPECGWRREEAS